MEQIISRQFAISEGNAEPLPLPDYDTYAICNLRGGIGKSSLCFNLSYLTDNVLMVDTCRKGIFRISIQPVFFLEIPLTVYDLILPHIMRGSEQRLGWRKASPQPMSTSRTRIHSLSRPVK